MQTTTRRRGALLALLIAVLSAAGLMSLTPASPAYADPVCQQGAYVLFARGSGEKLNDLRASKFQQSVMQALANRGMSSSWAELGNEDGTADLTIPGPMPDGPNEYPAVAVDNWNAVNVINGAYANSVAIGAAELITHLNRRYALGPVGRACNNETLVLGAYSQGADVVGRALSSGQLSQAVRDHVGYIALYGDPKFSPGPLWARMSRVSFQSDWWWVRGDDPGYFVTPFNSDMGALGQRLQYVPGEFKGRFGSWCAAFDTVCTGWPGGMGIHSNAYQNRWIAESADEIAYVAKLKHNQLNFGGSASSVHTYVTTPPASADPKVWVSNPYPTADNTRIALPSGAQFIWQRGVTLPVNYPDAVRYNGEGNSMVQLNWTGPMNTISLPPNTVIRPVGSNQQYLWSSGGQLLPIGDPATAACYHFSFPQSNPSSQPAVVPADWASTLPVGAQGQCSLGDGIRFTQSDTGPQQYVSVRGAALAVSFGDAQAYDGEGDLYHPLTLPTGYVGNPIHASVPPNTVLRAAGSPQQYFWDGGVLHGVPDPAASQCQLIAFPQNGVAVVPPSWIAGKPTSNNGQCSLADGTRFTESVSSGVQQYVSVRGAAIPLGYSEAQWYDQSGNTSVIDMVGGYVANPLHAAQLPIHTMVQPTGSNAQYLWDGAQLRYVPDPPTSACLLNHYPQNGVARVPAGWLGSLPVGNSASCA